jgi:hypothetical protein
METDDEDLVMIEEIQGKDFDFRTINLAEKDIMIPDSNKFVV